MPPPAASSSRRREQIDAYIGQRIKERRQNLGLTQQQLGDLIGITYQQVHKYEGGQNRVAVHRLVELSDALSIPIAWFFEGISEPRGRHVREHERMALELNRNFQNIAEDWMRDVVAQLARGLARASLRQGQRTRADEERGRQDERKAQEKGAPREGRPES